MKAAYVTQPGPVETIRVADLPRPEPGPGQVLVRVAVSAVNPIDTYVRGGLVAMPVPSPYIPGCDFAGVVEAVGAGVDDLAPGDRVWGSNQGLLGRQGALAEFVAADRDLVYATPEGVGDESAAAGALVGVTAHLGLFRDAGLREGETLLVIGGAGGVGSAVVQLAKAVGAEVIATAGGTVKAEAAKESGADAVIDYHAETIADGVARLAPDGVDVWWETRREPDLDLAVHSLAERGRLVLMAGRDARPAFPVGPFYVKGCQVLGFAMFKASAGEMRLAAEDLNRWLASGAYRPRIAKEFTLEEAAEAHALQESATIHNRTQLIGKIVVKIP